MNKQNSVYTIVYASVMVIIVAAVLAFTALKLKPIQNKNIEIDKKSQILRSVNIASTAADAEALYAKYITEAYIVNTEGDIVSKDAAEAFNTDMAVQSKIAPDKRILPVYVCTLEDGSHKYIFPMYGSGLWGPIWGYVAVDSNGNTIYGATFSHQGETPGLGAEIEKPEFSNQYHDKSMFIDGTFKSVAVEKKGQKPIDGADQVDAISGGTITSKGVQKMMYDCIAPYQNFLKKL